MAQLPKSTSVSVNIQEFPDLVSVMGVLAKSKNMTIARLVTDAIVAMYGPELATTRAFMASFVTENGTTKFTKTKATGGKK